MLKWKVNGKVIAAQTDHEHLSFFLFGLIFFVFVTFEFEIGWMEIDDFMMGMHVCGNYKFI